MGAYGLGNRNERGAKLVEFCRRKDLVIMNTWFEQEKRRRYTWKKPGDTGRFQIDYIMIRQRYRNSVKVKKRYPGADADTDHTLVGMKVVVKLKKMKRKKLQKRWNVDKLKTYGNNLSKEIENRIESMSVVGNNVEERWENLKDAMIQSAGDIIGYQKRKMPKKPWITQDMLEKMDERRRWKNVNTPEGRFNYNKMNNELRRVTDKAREDWWDSECKELEEAEKKGRSDLVYAKVKQLTWKNTCTSKNCSIKGQQGQLLTELDDIRQRWKEYVEQLYDKDGKPDAKEMGLEEERDVMEDNVGPEILRREIEEAIKHTKRNKAVGVDGIPAEFLKILGKSGTNKIVDLCNEMYRTGEWPRDFVRTTMIPLPKKTNAVECEDHRTISLICHTSKVMLRVLTNRIESKAKEFIGKTQFGFRKGVGTRDAIGVMRMLCERSLEHGNDVYICFVDFEKAFDRVNWIMLLEVLKDIGVDWRDRRLIMELYLRQEVVVRVADGESSPGIVGRGVRQGCLMSPLLFSIYAEKMMIEAMTSVEEGVMIGGELLKDVRFADDQGMVAATEKGLQGIMDALHETATKYGMKINIKKTKTMVVSKQEGINVEILVDGQRLEQVKKFKYLGATITEDGKCLSEIKVRIAMAREAFSKRKELLTRRISRDTRKRMVKTLVWPVALYGCESWTLTKEAIDRLNALEMWIWRRMERVSYKDKTTNEDVLKQVAESRKLLQVVINRKKNWIGHVVRHDCLLRDVIEGRMEGKRCRGRPRMGMIDELKEKSYDSMKRRAEDREQWMNFVPRTCQKTEHQ